MVETPSRSVVADYPDRIADIELQQPIGSSPSAQVFRARKNDQHLAIKVPRPTSEQDPSQEFDQFKQEAAFYASVDHPSVPECFEVGLEGDFPYLIMEYIDGQSLETLFDERTPMEVTFALDLIQQLVDVLRSLHDKGLVHRDLKPSNLLFSD